MAARQFWVDIDLKGNQLLNVVLEPLTADPAGKTGRMYFNSTTKKMMVHDGTAWRPLAGSVSITNVGTGIGVWKATDDNNNVELKSIKGGNGIIISSLTNEVQIAVDRETTLSGSPTKIPTSLAVKAYVDTSFILKTAIDIEDKVTSSVADDRVPSTKGVKKLINDSVTAGLTGFCEYVGVFDASKNVRKNNNEDDTGNIFGDIKKGQFWRVSVAGNKTGITSPTSSDKQLNVGDMIVAKTNLSSQAYPITSDWNDVFDVIDNSESPDIVRVETSQTLKNKTINISDGNVITGLNSSNFNSADILTSGEIGTFISPSRKLDDSKVVGEGLLITLFRGVLRGHISTITFDSQSITKSIHKMAKVVSAEIYDNNGYKQVVDIRISSSTQTVTWTAMTGFTGGSIVITGYGV